MPALIKRNRLNSVEILSMRYGKDCEGNRAGLSASCDPERANLIGFYVDKNLEERKRIEIKQGVPRFKNISLIGGLLYIAASGSGPLSLDAKLKKN